VLERRDFFLEVSTQLIIRIRRKTADSRRFKTTDYTLYLHFAALSNAKRCSSACISGSILMRGREDGKEREESRTG